MAEAGEGSVLKGAYPDDDNPPYAVHLRDRKDEPVQVQGRQAGQGRAVRRRLHDQIRIRQFARRHQMGPEQGARPSAADFRSRRLFA